MRHHFRLPAITVVALLLFAACGTGGTATTQAGTDTTGAVTDTTAPAADTTAAPATTAATETTAAATETTASAAPAGAMEMWERTGGNAPMVDALVAAWNEAEPDRPINLTYVDHAQMVPNLARAVASGDVPDLLGLDLIYGPEFAAAGHLVDVTDMIGDDPNLETASPGHIETATYEGRLYGTPLYADVSVLFWNKDLFRDAGLDPDTPPTNLTELHDMAAAINDPDAGVYGYYLAGNCAGCNIFTFGPLIWASDPEARIEAPLPGDEAMIGDIQPVLEWARMMHQEGLIDPAAQTETGETFAGVFGTGNVGIMGTGNFNVALLQDQNPDLDLGVTVLPGMEGGSSSFAGGDLVVIPEGSERVEDSVDFMSWLLTDEVQLEVYAKNLNMTTRSDVLENEYFQANEDVYDTAQAIPISKTPWTLKFFEMINSPNGPWLQMLQRVYYSDDDLAQVIADAKEQMEAIING